MTNIAITIAIVINSFLLYMYYMTKKIGENQHEELVLSLPLKNIVRVKYQGD